MANYQKEWNSTDRKRQEQRDKTAGIISDGPGAPKPDCVTYVYDNGGETFDRYGVYTNYPENDGCFMVLGMSLNPSHPQGFSQFSIGKPGKHNGRNIGWDGLPTQIQRHAACRLNDDD